MKTKSTLTFKVIAGIACFAGFLTISSEFSRSQSEKPEIRTGWNPEKQILLATTVPVQPKPFHLGVPEFVVKETQQIIKEEEKEKIERPVIDSVTKSTRAEKISTTQELTPQIPKVRKPALLDHTELQAMAGYLDYEILPGRGVRFRYNELRHARMGHEWFLKKPCDLRGKTVRIDYQGYVPREMTFRIAKSGASAAVEKKVVLEDSPYEPRSIFIDLPNTTPFMEVKHLGFWIERENAGRSHGDFMIKKVVALKGGESDKQVASESRPEPFPFDRPFVPTNLMRAEVPVS